MAKRLMNDKSYNGLLSDFKLLAQFTFIYETELKSIIRLSDFKVKYPKSTRFGDGLCKKIKYAKAKDLPDQEITDKFTLLFREDRFQLLGFMRHLRNSFVHALLSKQKDRLFIPDKNSKGRVSCKGWLDYKNVIQFIIEIQREFEESQKF